VTPSCESTIVVANGDSGFAEKLRSLLDAGGYEIISVSTLAEAGDAVAARSADVVVLGPTISAEAAVDATRTLLSSPDEPIVVGVLSSVDTTVMRNAMRAGMRDVLSAGEQTWSEVATAVRDAADAARGRQAGAGVVAATERPRGRVVVVAGMKGGVGKTTIATNLTAALAKQGLNVVLVDLDLHSGDTGIMMQLEPSRSIRDAAAQADRLDPSLLEGLLAVHSCGARVLLAPSVPDDTGIITATRVARMLDLLSQMSDVVVIDTPAVWDETTLAATEACDQVLAVTAMDVPSVKNTALMLGRLGQLGRSNGTVRVVLNRADTKVLLDEKDVEKALGRKVTARIPSDRAVPRSVNKGVPIVIDAPRSGVSKAVVELAKTVSTNGVK
jgi:pilus assembly protein CpaE